MSSETQPAPTPTWMFVTGWIFTILIGFAMIASGVVKFMFSDEKMFEHIGWSASLAIGLGILEITCALLYLIPRTSVFGAILLTGYLGGTIATHVRIGEGVVPQVLVGVFVWFGLFLRDSRLRALLPFRKDPDPLSLLIRIPMVLAFIVAILVVVVALQPGEYRITRSATMSAPPSAPFALVNDFHKWNDWSPWLKIDRAAKVTYDGPKAGEGAIYKWSGNDEAGEGMMTLMESVPDKRIRIKLNFIKPFAVTADNEFTFKTEGDKTVVTQTMSGERNLIMKAVALFKNMDQMIGSKFDEGFASMKAIVEDKSKK